jgi:hypothetical protein
MNATTMLKRSGAGWVCAMLLIVGCDRSHRSDTPAYQSETRLGSTNWDHPWLDQGAGAAREIFAAPETNPASATPPVSADDLVAALKADPTLSRLSHALRVRTEDGQVVIEGTVRTREEKEMIEQRAAQWAGKENIKSYLEVETTP